MTTIIYINGNVISLFQPELENDNNNKKNSELNEIFVRIREGFRATNFSLQRVKSV